MVFGISAAGRGVAGHIFVACSGRLRDCVSGMLFANFSALNFGEIRVIIGLTIFVIA
jgi:hypothetical protein